MRIELNAKRIAEVLSGAQCPTPGCEGTLAISYRWPMTLANLHIMCSICEGRFDPETVSLQAFYAPEEVSDLDDLQTA